MGLAKKLTDDLKVGVELEELPRIRGASAAYTQKVEGEMAVSDHWSVNVSQKTAASQKEEKTSITDSNTRDKPESEILLKYQQRF